MTRHAVPLLVAIAGTALTAAAGCGTSGSAPTLYHEVRFQVVPATTGQATFSVDSLVAGGTAFGFPTGTTFTTTGTFNFYLEGAASPYSGTFTQQGPDPITVTVYIDRSLVSGDNTSQGSGVPLFVGPVSQGAQVPPPPGTPLPQAPMVRFDVCAPAPGNSVCSTMNTSAGATAPAGSFGIPYSGSIGDQFFSHLLYNDPTRTTPGIYFLQNPQDSANGIVASASGQLLQLQLFIDGALHQTAAGTGNDVQVREDL
jgi:hypothetical protein